MYILTHMLQKDHMGRKVPTIATEGGSIGMTGSRNDARRAKAEINQGGTVVLEDLANRAETYIDWQMSKSTGHRLTQQGKDSVVLYDYINDEWYKENAQLHYLFITRCDEEELPQLPNLANCKGEGYHYGWACDDTAEGKAAQGNIHPRENGYHAWWRLTHLYEELLKDVEKRRFHTSLHSLGELATRNGTSDLPGWQDHTDSEHGSLLQWNEGVRAILTNRERSTAESAHARYHEHGNIHGMSLEHIGPLWEGVWTDPGMPNRDEISSSCETNDGAAETARRQLDILVGSENTEMSAEHHTPVASHAADDKRSKVLQIITKNTEYHDIIPDGSLLPTDLYDENMKKGCPL